MNSKMKKILSALMALAVLLAFNACSTEPSTGQEPPVGSNETQPAPEFPDESDWVDPYDDEYYDAMDDIMSARDEMLETFDIRWYNEAGMSEERQDFRLSCIKEGVNLAVTGSHGYNIDAIYNDALRNAYGLTGYNIAMSGQVDYVERTGLETVMLIKRGDLTNPFFIAARAYDDIPIIKGDWITVFGRISGIEQYSTTAANGETTWHDTIAMTVMDYYLGGTSSIYAHASGDSYTIWNLESISESSFVDGEPSMFQAEKDYWFGTYRTYDHGHTITITEDAVIEEDGETHPYKICGYCKDSSTGCYVLRIRYTEIEDRYPEGGYTLLCLFYQKAEFDTPDEVIGQMHDGTTSDMRVLWDYRLNTTVESRLYVMNKI